MSESGDDDYNDGGADHGKEDSQRNKKRKVQRACDVCRRKKVRPSLWVAHKPAPAMSNQVLTSHFGFCVCPCPLSLGFIADFRGYSARNTLPWPRTCWLMHAADIAYIDYCARLLFVKRCNRLEGL
jgi:hypothetical protein